MRTSVSKRGYHEAPWSRGFSEVKKTTIRRAICVPRRFWLASTPTPRRMGTSANQAVALSWTSWRTWTLPASLTPSLPSLWSETKKDQIRKFDYVYQMYKLCSETKKRRYYLTPLQSGSIITKRGSFFLIARFNYSPLLVLIGFSSHLITPVLSFNMLI